MSEQYTVITGKLPKVPKPRPYDADRAWKYSLRQFNLTPDQYNILFEKQNGVCKGCGQSETVTTKYGKVRRLAIDHDHSCCPGGYSCGNCIRGLLCQRCNSILGYANDEIDILLSLIKYVKDY